MNEDPAYLQTVSLHLARVLDEIGLNQVTVDRRRRAFLFLEHSITTCFRLGECALTFYHFGSQTEGTTTLGLGSDLDTLFCDHECDVIQNWVEWQPGKMNLLMLQEDTAPGYCRLQVLRPDLLVVGDIMNYVTDEYGRVILKNTCIIGNRMGHVRNGPAESRIGVPGFIDNDIVYAIKCQSWPRQALDFISRHRRHNWPTQTIIQKAITQGCFLVPVGHPLSPTAHLEWRLSASLAERCLMFSLNIVHIKVYVILKMLMKSFVEPRARKSISSYHCKTALLYCTENTEASLWIDMNILQCVTHCLALLFSWVTEGFCPQFIFPTENLFAGKVTAQNRGKLQSILRDLIISNGRVLLGVRIDELGLKLHAKHSITPSVLPVYDSQATVLLIGRFKYETQLSTYDVVNTIRKLEYNEKPFSAIRSVYTNIELLKGSIRELDKLKRQSTKAIIPRLYGWLGSMLASVSLSHRMRVPRIAIQLLHIEATSDIAAMLKLASVLYSNGDYRKVETILQEVSNRFISNTLQSICICDDNPIQVPPHFLHMMYALRGRKTRAKLFAYCVVFSRQEIHCAPPALQNEFFRSVGDDLQHRDTLQDEWMNLAVVDCLPYLYYLQFMIYKKLGKRNLQKQFLLNLEQCIRHANGFRHTETAWNILGQSMELENDPEAAMACYRTSLAIRPRINAANWHVAILCYKLIKPHL